MSFPTSILFQPAEGDPLGFLAERTLDTDPVIIVPQAYQGMPRTWEPYDPRNHSSYVSLHALALAWDTRVLPDGVSRGINVGFSPRLREVWVRCAANERRPFSTAYGWLQALRDSELPIDTKAKNELLLIDPMRVPLDIRSAYLFACVLKARHSGSVLVLDRDRREIR